MLWVGLGTAPNVESALGRWAAALDVELGAEKDVSTRAQQLSAVLQQRARGEPVLLVMDDAMTIIEALVEIVPTLGVDEQRRVLDVAIAFRDTQKVPPLAFPPADADDAAWDALGDQVRARSAIVLEREKMRLQALGLIDEHWNALTDELPPDMRESSQTSVET